MNTAHKVLSFLVLGITLGIALRKSYTCFVLRQPFFPTATAVPLQFAFTPTLSDATNPNDDAVYDFKRMLALIKQTDDVKEAYHAHFTGRLRAASKPMDMSDVKNLLQELYREQVRLERYIWQIKVQFKGHLPYRRHQRLRYYKRVLEKAITDVENVLRRL